ncbi:NAD(P)H-dependent oxidoreductase [Actinospica robiniae]|uniref:NAD(P)H-dependent oxidoreductase n=1 Tax=Actinospica robiniae TaxID=304901 RepID=UPI000425341A|nr:NAD(P)H-dependent oxidoreductase [Actinospica robiniae]
MAQVHLVYAHPSAHSFTREILDSFVAGLERAGHTHTISDLYAMDFRSELSLAEYERESAYLADAPIPEDVAAEHAKLNAADVWAFVYPVWWADCPARMKGWFDRVWTVGFSHKPAGLRRAEKAFVLCTAGYTSEQLENDGCLRAMRTVMLQDRIGMKARHKEFTVFGGSILRTTDAPDAAELWQKLKSRHLAQAAECAASI